MTDAENVFERHLRGIFADSEPGPDPQFVSGVLDALPGPSLVRPVVLSLAGLSGAIVAGWQFPNLVAALDLLLGGFGAVAADAVGAQALAMGLLAVGLSAVTLVLFRRGFTDG